MAGTGAGRLPGTGGLVFCAACSRTVYMRDPVRATLGSGRAVTRGACPRCGTAVFRIGEPPPARGTGRPAGSAVLRGLLILAAALLLLAAGGGPADLPWQPAGRDPPDPASAPRAGSGTASVFGLAISDGWAASAGGVAVTIRDAPPPPAGDPPSVDAGSRRTAVEGFAVHLSGSAAHPDGGGLACLWGRDSPAAAFAGPASPSTGFAAPSVHDGTAAFSDTVIIAVRGSGRRPGPGGRSGGRGYCARCGRVVYIRNPAQAALGSGRVVIRGTCLACGAAVLRTGQV